MAPPTFAIIVAQRADAQLIEDPESGIDFSRVVHADQRFTHHRPIVAGDRLVAELHVDGVRAMGGGAMITTRSEIFGLTPDGDRRGLARARRHHHLVHPGPRRGTVAMSNNSAPSSRNSRSARTSAAAASASPGPTW